MDRIAITGTFKTGKSSLSLILANLLGFQYIRPVTDYELRETFRAYNKEPDQFYAYYINCLFKLSNRLRNESLAEDCFISDGCIFNEVAYLKTYHEISSQNLDKRKVKKEQSLMVSSIENTVNYLFKERYDKIIKLDTNNMITGMLESDLQFKRLYDTFLEEMLYKSGHPYQTYQVNDFEATISMIIKNEEFKQKRSINEAIFKAKLNMPLQESLEEVAEIY
ncbi:MAG: ATP-binding protein [Prolixibacteraceae bacterium]|nr:ATP-binding protein [Prolixibacteraceae bacterium]